MALTPAQVEENKRAATEAHREGAYAVAQILQSEVPFDQHMFRDAFDACPYKMVGWGDPGFLLPAWQRGFNEALYQHYTGKKWVGRDDMDRDDQLCLNGRWTAESGESGTYANMHGPESDAVRLTKRYGVPFWPEDRGQWVSPRLAVIRGFVIGEPVSYGFNGDSYIAGRVTAMSGAGNADIGFRIITTKDHRGTERKFWRRGMTGTWKNDGTWSLMHGWHKDQNPSF